MNGRKSSKSVEGGRERERERDGNIKLTIGSWIKPIRASKKKITKQISGLNLRYVSRYLW